MSARHIFGTPKLNNCPILGTLNANDAWLRTTNKRSSHTVLFPSIDRRVSRKATVIFVPGLWGTPDEFSNKTDIQQRVQQVTNTHVCVPIRYKTDGRVSLRFHDAVQEMHAELIEHAEPPYVFASHSLGTIYSLLYTHMFPKYVRGIVGIESMADVKFVRRFMNRFVKDRIGNDQFVDIIAELEQLPTFLVNCPIVLHENIQFSEEESRRLLSIIGSEYTTANDITLRSLLVFRHLYFASLCARNPESKIVTYKGRTHNLHLEDGKEKEDIIQSILNFV